MKIFFIVIIFLLVACSSNSLIKMESNLGRDWLRCLLDSCMVSQTSRMLYSKCWRSELETCKGVIEYKLDSLQINALQKLLGLKTEEFCIFLNSNGIFNLYFKDNLHKIKCWQEDSILVGNVECLNAYLSFVKENQNVDTLKFIRKLDSLCKFAPTFQMQYLLFKFLSHQDSLKKMDLASILWNNSTAQDKEMYGAELLEVFSYLNKRLSSFDDILYFDDKEFDFGKVRLGEKKMAEFVFENIGRTAVIILGVESSCGCTIASYPKYPIKPGNKDKIVVNFKASSLGISNKTLILKTYGAKQVKLVIKAEVCE